MCLCNYVAVEIPAVETQPINAETVQPHPQLETPSKQQLMEPRKSSTPPASKTSQSMKPVVAREESPPPPPPPSTSVAATATSNPHYSGSGTTYSQATPGSEGYSAYLQVRSCVCPCVYISDPLGKNVHNLDHWNTAQHLIFRSSTASSCYAWTAFLLRSMEGCRPKFVAW